MICRLFALCFAFLTTAPEAEAQRLRGTEKVIAPSFTASSRASGCDLGSAQEFLDRNGVNALLFNNGALFWSGGDSIYEVPAFNRRKAIFAAGLWVGGAVGGEERFAGSNYGPYEFWPGPLDASGATDAVRCADFDQKMWKVSHSELRDYTAIGALPTNLATWPIAQGAPFFVDLDGDDRRDPATEPRIELASGDAGYSPDLSGGRQIDLAAGERPDLVGDQAIWWVMNDVGNAHSWSGSDPLGVEVRVLAYAIISSEPGIDNSTFYEVTVSNRSGETIEDSRVSFFTDYDLGNYGDDYLSSDAERGIMIAYNGDEFDEGAAGYGGRPPALGVDLLSGADGVVRVNSPQFPVPLEPDTRFAFATAAQRGLWPDGASITRGGDGYMSGGEVTSWMFDGDPVTYEYWTEENVATDRFEATEPGDRAAVITTPPETLSPGESRRVDIAILFANAPALEAETRLHSVSLLRDISDAVQEAYDQGGPPAIGEITVAYTPPPEAPLATTLVTPEDGQSFETEQPDTITFEWTPVSGADAYFLEFSSDPQFDLAFPTSDDIQLRVSGTSLTVPRAGLLTNAPSPTYWRVRPANWGGYAPAPEVRTFDYTIYSGEFASFDVTSNAAGPLVPPEPGAADFGGYPTQLDNSRPGPRQQVGPGRWLISSAGTFSFDAFLAQVLRDGQNNPFPFDYEIRFTGSSAAYVDPLLGQPLAVMEVPFELWNIGADTPDDPSDDVRLIPRVYDADGDGTFNLSALDSPLSADENDPETDELHWSEPIDMAPGESGYLTWEASEDPALIGREVMARMTFVSWNGGTAPPYAQPLPEEGTIFRILTTNPIPIADERGPERAPLALSVHPNPARGPVSVPFRLKASSEVRLSVVDVLGREVSVLASGAHASGRHRAELDTSDLAAGVYVVVLTAEGERVTRTVTIVR